jgi:PAS domain-containing protein
MISSSEIRENFNWLFTLGTKNISIVLLTCFIAYQYFQIKELKSEIKDLQVIQSKNIELEKRLNAIASEIIIFKAAGDDLPIPKWTKDLNGKIIYINSAFLNKYLRPKGLTNSDVVGKYDENLFPLEAENYRANDQIVLDLERPILFLEKEGKRNVRVLKYPYKINGVVIGVNGIEYAEFKP